MKTRHHLIFGSLATVLFTCPGVQAATKTWNIGNGTWDASNTNWTSSAWANGSDATFSGSGGTITLGSGFTPTVGSSTLAVMNFAESYTIKTGSIYLASTAGAGSATTGDQIKVASGKTATLDGIALTWGTAGGYDQRLAVSGSGTLSLLNTNLTGGQFYIGNAGGDTGNVNGHVIQSGGTVALNGALYMGDADAETDTYQLDSGNINIIGTSLQNGLMIVGRRGAATFTQNGGAVTVQRYNNNTTGEVPAIQIGFLGTSAYNMTGGTFTVLGGTDGSINATWLGGGGGAGNGTLTINGATAQANLAHVLLGGNAATGTGTVNLQAGTLRLTNIDKTTDSTGNFNFSGGLLAPHSANATIGSATAANNFDITLTGTAARISSSDKDGTGRTVNVYSKITSNGALTSEGAGTTVLQAANDYSGATTIKAGTLALSSTGTIANSTTIVVGDAGSSGTVLDVTAKSSFAIGSGQTLKGIGNVNIGAGKTVTINGTLAAGNSIGTNSVTGNLTLAGTTQIELGTTGASHASPGTSDRTNVSGSLVLGGGLTVIDNAGANSNGGIGAGSYKIFSQAGTATGSFSSITNIAGYHAKVDTATSGSVFLDNYALATANTIAAVNLGKARVGGSFSGSGALTVSNATAANNGFTEGLNATQGAVTGGVVAGGSNVSNLAGASSSTSLTAGFSTATSGAKSGTTTINLASNGSNSGYADTSLGSQTVGVTGSVYDYATALFSQTGGDGSLSGSGTSYTLNFGAGLLLNTYYTATLQLANGTFFNAFQDNLGGSYALAGASEFSTTAAAFSNLASNGNNSFTITFNTGSTGTFNGTLDFAGLSQQSGLTDANLANINIAFTGTAVPEPNVAALLGGLGMLALLRRRRA